MIDKKFRKLPVRQIWFHTEYVLVSLLRNLGESEDSDFSYYISISIRTFAYE